MVLISYAGPPSFQLSDNWKQIHAALLEQLPLRNIHWTSPSRPSIRTIQELDISLVSLDTLRDERTSQIPLTVLEKPLLNIYFLACEDVETYKSTFKRQIKDWLTSIIQRKQEWLVVHIPGQDTRAPAGTFFQMKGTVLDRIRADFNTEKRDRCVQLSWTNRQSNPAVWAEVIAKIKEGVLVAFDLAISQREDDVRRSESQRQMPGWNFCTFFILKESLASSFEGVNLFEDALFVYDELEAAFFQVLREKNLSWFGTLISPTPKDDAAPLLAIDKKPYRDLILANTISVFDFRIYLLARQCALLAKLGNVNEIPRKASAFLAAFGRRLSEEQLNLPDFFVESWIYSSALSVVEQCDTWASELMLPPQMTTTFNAGKGELLELARNQLNSIGIQVGHLPSTTPFSLAFSSAPTMTVTTHNPQHSSQQIDTQKISQTDLLSSLDDREKFYELYVGLTNRAIDMYVKAGRRKFALKLHGSLAALDVHRGRLASALQTYTSLPAHYAPHMWTSLESFMLSRALEVHLKLDRPKDREWIHMSLAFLKAYVEGGGKALLAQGEEEVKELLGSLRKAAGTLEEDLQYLDHPALSLHIPGHARIAGTEDGSILDVKICNRLSCTISIDEVSIALTSREAESFFFRSKAESLAPGDNALTLYCPTSQSGIFILESSEIKMARLHLQWTHRKFAAGSSKTGKDKIMSVRIPKDPQALDVRLQQPPRVELGKSPSVLVNLCAGRHALKKASLKLSTPTGVRFSYQEATCDREGVDVEFAEDSVVIRNIRSDDTVSISLPHSDASGSNAMEVNIDIEYITTSEPSIVRALRLTRTVPTSLPIAVNVQDFFRGTRLFSRFTISTTTRQHVRISSARLDGPNDGTEPERLKICAAGSQQKGITTVTPAQPANFLFRIDSAEGPVRESLALIIKFRMLREEVKAIITEAVEEVLEASPSLEDQRKFLVNKVVELLESDASWVETYRITGELNLPELKDEWVGAQQAQEAMGALRQNLLVRERTRSPAGPWREIRIPVDMPQMSIVAAARIQILPTAPSDTSQQRPIPPLYAGQPISAVLSVTTTFHWSGGDIGKESRLMMRFDIEEMVRVWLVSGRKRGHFAASHGGTYTVPITLIALHHGELALPNVAVTSLPLSADVPAAMGTGAPSTETYQVHGAERVLVLPRGGRSTFIVGMV